jgi:hemoglobin
MKLHTLVCAATLAACGAAHAQSANPAGADAIQGAAVYKAFHEQAGIDRIIDDFVPRIAADPRIAKRFVGSDLPHLNAELKSAHSTMGLENLDFNALAEDLQLSMNKEKVSFSAQNKLLAKLAPMQRAIVTK